MTDITLNKGSYYHFMGQNTKKYIPILILVLIAFALQIHQLGSQNFSGDEILSIRFGANFINYNDNHPPLYYGVVAVWQQLGDSEFFLRFTSVIVSILAISLFYQVGNKLIGYQNSLVATLLMSVSPIIVWHAQDLRMYSQLLMFSGLTIYLYCQVLSRKSTVAWWKYAIGALLALFTHIYAILLIIALGIHFLLFYNNRLRGWLTAHIFIALAYIPALLFMLSHLATQVGYFRQASPLYILYTYFAFVVGYDLGPTNSELRLLNFSVLQPYLPLLILLGTLVSLLGIVGLRTLWKADKNRTSLIVLIAVFPVMAGIIISAFFPRVTFNVRYVIVALPAFLWIIASGIRAIYPLGKILLLVLLVVSGAALQNHYLALDYAKEDVRSAAQYIQSTTQPETPIVVITVSQIFHWYFEGQNTIVSYNGSLTLDDLIETIDHDRVWLVQSRVWQADPDGQVETYFNTYFTPITTQNFQGVKITEYCRLNCDESSNE